MKIDIIILNYNGEKLIPQCVPSIVEAKNNSKHDLGIYVIDNESTDKSVKVLEAWHDRIKVIPHSNDFFCSFYDVARDLSSDVIILLNNDIRVDRNFIEPLADVFLSYTDVFLVAPKVLTFEGMEENGATIARLRLGLFWSSASPLIHKGNISRFSHTFSSGFGAFDRKKFAQLGGYDNLYLPGRFEDSDLSLKAWRMGWPSYYEPASIVYHMGQAAFRDRFGTKGINRIDGRNIFLFMWKNYGAPDLIKHFVFLPLWVALWTVRGAFHYITGLFQECKMIGVVAKKRAAEKNVKYPLTMEKALAESRKRLEA